MNMKFKDLKHKLNNYLVRMNLKMTQERVMILKAIWKQDHNCCDEQRDNCQLTTPEEENKHFSADDICTTLNASTFPLSQSTVYRALQLFCDAEIISFSFKRNGKTIYELNDDRLHDHLICVRCNKVIEFNVPETDILHRKLCEQYQFSELDHIHCIRGICNLCKQAILQ
jgi:Fur family ferric uptake transcriptional regulator